MDSYPSDSGINVLESAKAEKAERRKVILDRMLANLRGIRESLDRISVRLDAMSDRLKKEKIKPRVEDSSHCSLGRLHAL